MVHMGDATLKVWCPDEGPTPLIVRWFMTEWCNYACTYCPQTHDRRAPKGRFTAHAFDNHPLERWIEAFDRHFSAHKVSLVITGGEPMIDARNMPPLLRHLAAQDYVACIRIDTNASWSPDRYADIDLSKIVLMCTFHPGQVEEESFLENVRRLRQAGFAVGMVNYVMNDAAIPEFERRRKVFQDQGLLLHPNPLWNGAGHYGPEAVALMEESLPPLDFAHRAGRRMPLGRQCLFPSISYELKYTGEVRAGCGFTAGDFFATKLPARPKGWRRCPYTSCVCLDKYSFLRESDRNVTLNPLADYAESLWAIAKAAGGTAGTPADG